MRQLIVIIGDAFGAKRDSIRRPFATNGGRSPERVYPKMRNSTIVGCGRVV